MSTQGGDQQPRRGAPNDDQVLSVLEPLLALVKTQLARGEEQRAKLLRRNRWLEAEIARLKRELEALQAPRGDDVRRP